MQRISTLILVWCLFALNLTAQNQKKYGKVSVYTTADSSDLRLTKIETPSTFSFKGQPFENEVCIFVDGNKRFQTFEGIGGAITDASAETFYKLPKEKQEELLKAYYDSENGIGYVIARTNINSCDD
jgi:glucosylceramidase